MPTSLPLATYRIAPLERHVRALPASLADGSPFIGPGVDLRGKDASSAIDAARPVFAWLDAREPGVVVRFLFVRCLVPRVLVSLLPAAGMTRPRTVRLEGPYASELREAARDAERLIGEACHRVLARRARPFDSTRPSELDARPEVTEPPSFEARR